MNSKKRKLGDRKDAVWLKDVPGLTTIMMHMWTRRTECEVYLQDKLDVTDMLKYIAEKNQNHPEYKTTIFHAIVTSVARIMMEREKLNRFVQGRRLYQRNELSIGFVAKRRFADDAEESLMVITPKDEDTLDSISASIYGNVRKERAKDGKADEFNAIIDAFARIPRPLLALVLGIIKKLDFFGKVPNVLRDGDTHFTSILLTNLGSVGCSSVYHHLANYGTNSFILAIGTIHKENILMEDGTMQVRDIVDIGATIDERIADGFYFARSLKLLKHIMKNPELLDQPLGEKSGYDYES